MCCFNLFFHAVCMIRCCAPLTEEIYFAPRNANLSNIGRHNEIMLVLNGSVTKCIVSCAMSHHHICNIVSVQTVHLILILDVLTQSK